MSRSVLVQLQFICHTFRGRDMFCKNIGLSSSSIPIRLLLQLRRLIMAFRLGVLFLGQQKYYCVFVYKQNVTVYDFVGNFIAPSFFALFFWLSFFPYSLHISQNLDATSKFPPSLNFQQFPATYF